CVALLQREPARRPSGEEILALLRPEQGEGQMLGLDPGRVELLPFVGRDESLEELESAYDEMIGGRTVTVEVSGRSGVGKTSLVRRFLDRVAEYGNAVVLWGRCYEQESVPYKGLDSLVDALSQLLVR